MTELSDIKRLAILNRMPKNLTWTEHMTVDQEGLKWYLEKNKHKTLVVCFRKCRGLDLNFLCDLISTTKHSILCKFQTGDVISTINGCEGSGYAYRGTTMTLAYWDVFELQQYVIDNDLEAAIERRNN